MKEENFDAIWKKAPTETFEGILSEKEVLWGTDPQPGGNKFGESCRIVQKADEFLHFDSSIIPVRKCNI